MLLVVGRLYSYKGVDAAVEAFATVSRNRPECQLIVAGRGPIADGLQREPRPGVQVRNWFQSEQELEELFAKATLVLLPYRDATQSGVGLQAISRGIPCIVSDAGALPDLMQPVAAECVVRSQDPPALARAILECLDHDVSFREAVQAHAREQFGWDRIGALLLKALRDLRIVEMPPRAEGAPSTDV